MSHIELHILATAEDAARIAAAGLPRFDLEPQECGACNVSIGEVLTAGGDVLWRPCGLLLDGDSLALLCKRCLEPIPRVLGLL